MAKKEGKLGIKILVAVVAIIGSTIAGINLLTVFGFIDNPNLFMYIGIVGIITLPLVIIGAVVNEVVVEQKKALKQVMKGSGSGDTLELKIKFEDWETTIGDTTIHPAFYAKIALASVLSVSLGLFIYLIATEGFIGNIMEIYPFVIGIIGLISVIHLFSKNIFKPHGWREFLEHTWIALFTITISISIMISLRAEITTMYPRKFWESFMGLPFSLQALMFFVMLMLIGAIFIRMGDLARLRSSPFKASGVTLVLVSLSFLIPQFELINWNQLLRLMTMAFSVALTFYGLVLSGLLYKDSGLRYLVTNERIIKLNTNDLRSSKNYKLSHLKELEVQQGSLASKLGYGNLVAFFKGKSDSPGTNICVLHGVKRPNLLMNTIEAVAKKKKKLSPSGRASGEGSKPIKKRKKVKKKKPKKKLKKKKPKRKIKKKKKTDKNSADKKRYSIFLVFLLLSISMIFPAVESVSSSASRAPSPQGADIVERYRFEYDSLYSINVSSVYEIYNITLDGQKMTADQIRGRYSNESWVKEKLKNRSKKLINRTLNETYRAISEEGINTSAITVNVNETSLQSGQTDSPVKVNSSVDIELEREYFDFPAEADIEEMITGYFQIGGKVENRFTLTCEPGHHNIYDFNLSGDLRFENGEREKRIEIDNVEGDQKDEELITLVVHKEDGKSLETDSSFDVLVDAYSIERGVNREYIEIDLYLTGEMRNWTVPPELSRALPDYFNLTYINTDFIRLLYSNGFEEQIDGYLKDIKDEIPDRLSETIQKPVSERPKITGYEGSYNPSKMSSGSSLELSMNTSFEKNISERDQAGIFDIKTKYKIEEKISFNVRSIRTWPVEYTFKLPEGVEMMSAKANGVNLDEDIEMVDGRYTITHEVPEGGSYKFSMTVGTKVKLNRLFPFIGVLIALFIVWIALSLYTPKEKKKRLKI